MLFKRIAASITTLISLLAVFAAPASAAASDCTNGRLCTWNNTNFSGTRWEWNIGTITTLPNQCLNMTASASDNQSSLYNRVGIINTYVAIYSEPNCTGPSWVITTGMIDSNLASGAPINGFDNTMRSIGARTS